MWCIVSLPNGTQQAVLCDPKAIGQECLEKVCKSLNMICEMEYFGLEHWSPTEKESRTRQWINLRNRLSQDSGSGHGTRVQLMLALRVKFWVPVHLILQESVRNIFYMQAKMDLIEGRLNAKDWKNSAKLSALCAQADGIRFNVQCLTAKCPIRMKKDKEHVLAFKKRRLSKQKSLDSIEIPSPVQPEIEDESSPLSVYKGYIIRPVDADDDTIPDDFLRQIALEHEKLTKVNMAPKSAKYWLLKEIQELLGFGEEVFSGFVGPESSIRCDICVGPNGLVVCTGDEKKSIPFSAIAKGKSLRRTFKLEYIDDDVDRKELEVKFPKHAMAAGVYRSITERHAFYVCDKVRMVVTSQFTRDLKGTIASMFKEDTELGKRYVFDIQRTCREVHDQARRILHERGIEINGPATTTSNNSNNNNNNNNNSYIDTTLEQYSTLDSIDVKHVDNAIKEKEYREAVIERFVDNRITEAMTCKICMDKEINTMFSPCGHVTACSVCAAKCDRCPNCREKVISVGKIFLPPELRVASHNPTVPTDEEVNKKSVNLNLSTTV